MATIKEIARKTGVSITTVSRVLNQDKNFKVSDQTRIKIITAAEELEYKVNNKKVNKEKHLYRIGLVYWYTTSQEMNDPYYLSIRLSIENSCKNQSIEVEHIYLPESSYEAISKLELDGVIALGKYSQYEIEQLYSLHKNLVLVDCFSKHYNIDVVIPDLDTATAQIIDYFFDKNVNNIGLICGVETTSDDVKILDPRLTSYKNEMSNKKAYYADYIKFGKFTADSGYEIMSKIIKDEKLLDAYIVTSDTMALGCLKALNENNKKVPQSVSIFSFDNTSFSQFTIPSLSSVEINKQLIGQSAVKLLMERLTEGRNIAKKVIIPTKLIIRDSV